ncbi:hypothetical protein DPMN_116840 [Dreissena polymorpha]|uniref:Uncharacterized protein n=1 Tax=Dreissena polymorpha TaxID=45954 RepID=A0A9D4KQJ8_DREPO|nr:hypothetical protein DPMN_116840 [Dreissena polymorpha]
MWTNGRRKKTNFKTSPEQSDIYKTNHFTKFHDDWAKNVTYRKTAPLPGSQETNLLTKFHEIGPKIEKCAAHWRPCFSPIWTIFELVQDINKTNVLSNFHDDWAKIVTSSVKTAPPTGGHFFQRTRTTFELNQHIIKTNILTNDLFHGNRTKKVASRVFTKKSAPPTGGHVFQRTRSTFELNQHIIGTKLLTKFYEDRKRNVPSSVYERMLTDEWTDGRRTKTGHKSSPEQSVFTCFHYIHIEKNVPPTGGHVFSPIWIIFELVRDIN